MSLINIPRSNAKNCVVAAPMPPVYKGVIVVRPPKPRSVPVASSVTVANPETRPSTIVMCADAPVSNKLNNNELNAAVSMLQLSGAWDEWTGRPGALTCPLCPRRFATIGARNAHFRERLNSVLNITQFGPSKATNAISLYKARQRRRAYASVLHNQLSCKVVTAKTGEAPLLEYVLKNGR